MNGEILDELVYICLKRLLQVWWTIVHRNLSPHWLKKNDSALRYLALIAYRIMTLGPFCLVNYLIVAFITLRSSLIRGGCGATICFAQKSSIYFILSWISTLPSACFTQIQTFLHQPTRNHCKNTSLNEGRRAFFRLNGLKCTLSEKEKQSWIFIKSFPFLLCSFHCVCGDFQSMLMLCISFS